MRGIFGVEQCRSMPHSAFTSVFNRVSCIIGTVKTVPRCVTLCPPGRGCFLLVLTILLLGCVPTGLPAQPVGGLFGPRPSFNLTNHLVSVSVFQWFTSNGGQLSGPWQPVEGRSNWTGTTNFWRSQLKEIMAANIDVLYVHLIP